jgi:hypothetical protein
MKFAFFLFATFLLTTQSLRNFYFCKNCKINSRIDSCSNRHETGGNRTLKQIIDTLLTPRQIIPKIIVFPKITRECEEGDWESGEIPWDFVENGNVSVALDPHSITMLLL